MKEATDAFFIYITHIFRHFLVDVQHPGEQKTSIVCFIAVNCIEYSQIIICLINYPYKESQMSLVHIQEIINTDPPQDKLSESSKLNLCDSNQSFKEGLSTMLAGSKRNVIDDNIHGTVVKSEETNSVSSNKSMASRPSSWDAKRMKIDLIAAKAQITKMEECINHKNIITKEQILFGNEKASLQEQHKRDEQALSDMGEKLAEGQRKQELQLDYSKVVTQYKESKIQWDELKAKLQKQVADLKDKLLESEVSSKSQMSEMKKSKDELLQALEYAQFEVNLLKKEVELQTSRVKLSTTLCTQFEKQRFELQQLRAKERLLRAGMCNTLLLEEQVQHLTTRLNGLQPMQQQLHEAEVKITTLECSLEEWRNIACFYGMESAQASKALYEARNLQLESNAHSSQRAQLYEELNMVKLERDKATLELNEMEAVREQQETLILRLQKRQLLTTREADTYRDQLKWYEEELKMKSLGERGEEEARSAELLAARVAQLEQSLYLYREVMADIDSPQQAEAMENVIAEVRKWRDEAELARRDAQNMREQNDILQMHLERVVNAASSDRDDNPPDGGEQQK